MMLVFEVEDEQQRFLFRTSSISFEICSHTMSVFQQEEISWIPLGLNFGSNGCAIRWQSDNGWIWWIWNVYLWGNGKDFDKYLSSSN